MITLNSDGQLFHQCQQKINHLSFQIIEYNKTTTKKTVK